MHPLATNISTPTCDVRRFGFEPAGALEIDNEYSGLAAKPAHLYCFRGSQARMPHIFNLAYWRSAMSEDNLQEYSAFVGLDWSHSKHDVCVQPAGSEKRLFDVVEHNPASLAEWITDLHRPVDIDDVKLD